MNRLKVFVVLVVALFFAVNCVAEDNERSPFKRSVSLNKKQLAKLITAKDSLLANSDVSDRFFRLDDDLVIKAGIPFLGRVRLTFNRIRLMRYGQRLLIDADGNKKVDTSPEPFLLRGYVEKRSENLGKISASLQGDKLIIELLKDKRGRLIDLSVEKDGRSARYRRNSMYSRRKASCNEVHDDELLTAHLHVPDNSAKMKSLAGSYKVLELAVDADYEYYAANGDNTASAIAARFNAVEALYEDSFKVTFDIVSQRVYTSSSQPYTSSDIDKLLDQMESATSSLNADLKHLLTGKDIYAVDDGQVNDSVAGVAYMSVLCLSQSANIGMSEDFVSSSINSVVTAHEIGHNFGANHSSEKSIMYPSALSSTEYYYFAGDSVTEMDNHVTNYGSCLSLGDADDDSDEEESGGNDGNDGDEEGGSNDGDDNDDNDDSDDDESNTPSGEVTLSVSLDKSTGILTFSSSYSSDRSACTLSINLASKKNMSAVHTLGEFAINYSSSVVSAKKKRRSKGRAFAQAVVNCAGSEIKSEIVKIKGIKKIKSRKKAAANKWIKLKRVSQQL